MIDPVSGGMIVPRNTPDFLFEETPTEEIEEKKAEMDAKAYEKVTETLQKTLDMYEDVKERLGKVEENSDAHGELKGELETLRRSIKEGVIFSGEKGDGEVPDYIKKIHTEHQELKADLESAILFNKKYQDKTHVSGFSDIMSEKKKFSFLKYAVGSYYHAGGKLNDRRVSDPWKGAEFERDVIIELARRSNEFGETYRDVEFAANDASDANPAIARIGATRDSLDSDARGGVLFPDGVMDLLIVPLLQGSLPEQLGMTVISDLGRNKSLSVPIMESGGLTDGNGWIGEGGEIDRGKSKFKTRKLTPKKYAGRIAVTREALNSITPTQEMAWRNYIMNLFRINALSMPIFSGTGTGAGTDSHGEGQTAQPNGLLNDTGIPAGHKIDKSAANAGATFSLDYARQLVHALEEANASELPNLKWVMRKAMCTQINWAVVNHYTGQTKEQNPGYLFLDKVQMGGMLSELGGYPIVANNNVPNNLTKGTASGLTAIGLGNWSDYYQAIWRGMGVMYNPYSEDMWSHDMIEMRVILETDLLNTRPEAFGYITRLVAA